MEGQELLYIKVILPKQARDKKVRGGGSPPEPLKVVTQDYKRKLIALIQDIEVKTTQLPQALDTMPIVVDLEKKALAKTHRPNTLFTNRTCPIIGADKPGRLFIKGSLQGLTRLRHRIERDRPKPKLLKDISTIKHLRPLEASDRLAGITPEQLFHFVPRENNAAAIKVSLFDFSDTVENSKQALAFGKLLAGRQIKMQKCGQFTSQHIYKVWCNSVDDVRELSDMVMVKSISKFPIFKSLIRKQFNYRPMPGNLSRPGEGSHQLPVVAVVHSGIAADNPSLNEWILARERYVNYREENTDHGTFVAGLIVWGDLLNPGHSEIGNFPCRLLDVHVLPNDDSSRGPQGRVTELELLQALEACLKKYAREVKVWNLSLGSDEICQLDRFSSFAVELDNLQEKYGVSFVIAAGNYTELPLLSYPRTPVQADTGRITTPADSVLGITVSSIAQLDHPIVDSPRRGQPSPFARNGPGPNYIIKPDLVHFGGNIGLNASMPLGITSLTVEGKTSEDIGTSFSTPLISRQLAYIYHSITPTPSPIFARALLTHSARDLRTGDRVTDGDDHYVGFGTPLNLDRLIECTPWMTTLVFAENLQPGHTLEWDDFPYPASLIRGGKFYGEIWMTLAYAPQRNIRWGSEYCESHIDVSFGVFRKGKYSGLCPIEHDNKGELFESFQVQNLRKWAPVRTYYRKIEKGVLGDRWKLSLKLLCRHGIEKSQLKLQPFTLILSIADPNHKELVYNEMTQQLRSRFQTQNLLVKPTVQVRAKI